jgi:hypothetical protein
MNFRKSLLDLQFEDNALSLWRCLPLNRQDARLHRKDAQRVARTVGCYRGVNQISNTARTVESPYLGLLDNTPLLVYEML